MDVQIREVADTTIAMIFEQHTTAHMTVHLPPHGGNT
jgi:hypothetical protein